MEETPRGERVRVLDFGLDLPGRMGLTGYGAFLSITGYTAPKQAGARSWMAGPTCSAWAACYTGWPTMHGPFRVKALSAVLRQVETFDPPREAGASVPADLSYLVIRLLALCGAGAARHLRPGLEALPPQRAGDGPRPARPARARHAAAVRPRPLTSDQYADAFNEVKNYGGDGVTTPTLRTPEQTEIGIFWGYDGSPGLGAPPRFYNQIAETIAVQQGNTAVQNARLFSLIDVATADAAITC